MCSRRRRRRQMTETSTDQRTGSRRGRACAMMTLSRNDASSATRHRVVGGSCSVKMTTWNHEWKWKCRNIKFVDSSLLSHRRPVNTVREFYPLRAIEAPTRPQLQPPPTRPPAPSPGNLGFRAATLGIEAIKMFFACLLRWTKRPCKNLFIRD